jgi:hypothetical protein
MFLVKNIDQYDNTNIYFCDPIKNNIMHEGMFIRIIYSTPLITLNGINLIVHLNDVNIEKYYNKYKCTFNINTHRDIIDNIRLIEMNLLKSINIYNKSPQYKVFEQLRNGNIKLFLDNDNMRNNISSNTVTSNLFMLKISGIWETDTQYGITYKFSKISPI